MKMTRDVVFVMFIAADIYLEPLWSILITANLSRYITYMKYGGYENILGFTVGYMVSLQVVLSQWLYQNMDSVASMYEDRFDLRTLESQVIQDSSKDEANKSSWWKNIGVLKSRSVSSPLSFVVIKCISVPVKRTKELRALTGWYVPYCFCLLAYILKI